jgi:hypothetical protein
MQQSIQVSIMIKNIPIYKIILTDAESIEIALVDEPAIEVDFLKFNSEQVKLEFNEDKMIVKGAVLIPDKLIYRNDRLGERFVKFDTVEVEKVAMLFLKNGMRFNRSHSDIQASLDILESYLATEGNEFNVPLGSWIISAKIKDDALWQEIKNGTFNGFSFEGMFSNELIGTQEIKFNKNEEMEFKEKLQTVIDAVFFANEKPEDTSIVAESVTPEITESVTPEMFSKEQAEELILNAVTSITEKFNSQLELLTNQLKESNTKLEEFSKQPLSAPVQESVNQPIVLGDNPALRYFTK